MNEPRRPQLTFIFLTLVLDTLGIGLVVPVMPELIRTFVGGDLALASRYYGAFLTAFAVMQFLFAPVLGGLSDRFGRRPVLLASLIGAAVNYALLATLSDLRWLFVARVITGLSSASISTATAFIADVTPPEKRAQSFGLVGAAFGIGFVLGPIIGGFLGAVHLRAPFYLASGLAFANFLYGVLILPESLPREKRRAFSVRRSNPFVSLGNLRRYPLALGLTGGMFCGHLGQQILQATWALHGKQRFDWTAAQVGASFTAIGVATAVVQGGLVRAVIPRLGERRTVIAALCITVSGFVGFALADRAIYAYLVMFPFCIGGLSGPALQSIITRGVPSSEQGELQGSLASLMSLSAIIGPGIGTGLLARFGPKDAIPHVPGAPFFASAAINVLGLLLVLRLFARMPPDPEQAPSGH